MASKRIAAVSAALTLLVGCSSFQPILKPFEVDVPVPVGCIHVLPSPPNVIHLSPASDDPGIVAKAAVEIILELKGAVKERDDLLKACLIK